MIERAGEDFGPDRFIDRNALAGQGALVDRRRALRDDAVDRDPLAGPDGDRVADANFVDRQVDLAAVADHVRNWGTEVEDPTNRRLGPVKRIALDALPAQRDKDDECRRHLLAQHDGRQGRHRQGQVGSNPSLKQPFERAIKDPGPAEDCRQERQPKAQGLAVR